MKTIQEHYPTNELYSRTEPASAVTPYADASVSNRLRLDRVRDAAAVNTNGALDRLTQAAVTAIGAAVAAIALVDEDRQIFKSVSGLPSSWRPSSEIPLTHSFCVHAVVSGLPFVIEDARSHPLVRENPSVVELGIGAYAGIPLTTKDGLVLGTFHTIEWCPRRWTPDEIALLRGLAALAIGEIELSINGSPTHRLTRQPDDSRPPTVATAWPHAFPPRATAATEMSRRNVSAESLPSRAEIMARAQLQRAVGPSFIVGERIGRGGFADVYDGFDRRLKRAVAFKVPRPDKAATADSMAKFRREAETIAALRHPNVLPIHMIGEAEGMVWLVLARVDGESLAAWLKRTRVVPVTEAVRMICAIAAALGAAHNAGIVHRDITPGNIMLDGPHRHVLLMDFGLARVLHEHGHASTLPGLLVGTPHFVSPEQAAGEGADHRSDIYSLGVIGYRLLAGRFPVEGSNGTAIIMRHLVHSPAPLRELRRDCPNWLARIVERCLAKAPEARWQTADEIVDGIAAHT